VSKIAHTTSVADNELLNERTLLDRGMADLEKLLDGLQVQPYTGGTPQPANPSFPLADARADKLITIGDPMGGGFSGPVLIEARRTLTPVLLQRQVRTQVEFMRRLNGDAAVLVISAWISPRSRQTLDDLGYGYLDLTGNVSFRLTRPMIRIRLDGARIDPSPATSQHPRLLKGLKAGRLVRALTDVTPPYTATHLADATKLSAAYISRLLESLEDQAIISRRGRAITDVEWNSLLRARAESYDLLKAGTVASFAATQGLDMVLNRIRNQQAHNEPSGRVAVTGPVAAAKVSPITVGGQLILYLEVDPTHPDPQEAIDTFSRSLRLLPSAQGGNVLLLTGDDPVIFTGTRLIDGVPHVALSQLALDSLSGPGRMPAEAEEILDHMSRNMADWRLASLDQWHLQGA
jgi:hypothetical protein